MTEQSGHPGTLDEKCKKSPATPGDGNVGAEGEKKSSTVTGDDTGRKGDTPPYAPGGGAPAARTDHGGRAGELPPYAPSKKGE